MKLDTKQYCRYCSYLTVGDVAYCSYRGVLLEKRCKQVNKCKYYEFNSIDAFQENKNGYRPRKLKRNHEKLKLGELDDEIL